MKFKAFLKMFGGDAIAIRERFHITRQCMHYWRLKNRVPDGAMFRIQQQVQREKDKARKAA